MKTGLRLIVLPLLTMALQIPPAQAHFFAERHSCKPPVKPLEFVTELDKKNFDAQVEKFRSCLESFVKKQNDAMQKHKESAERAAADWKEYAEKVLKAEVKAPAQAKPTK